MLIVSNKGTQKYENDAYRTVYEFYITDVEDLKSDMIKGCATDSKALNIVTEEIYICIGLNQWQKFGTEEVVTVS